MLSTMSEEGKLQVFGRLCHDVLGGLAEQAISMTANNIHYIISDTFFILGSKVKRPFKTNTCFFLNN